MGSKRKDEIIAVIDTREQAPLDLARFGLQCRPGTLQHGDYSLLWPDMRRQVAIERKSLPDLIACCGNQRRRFETEVLALRGYRYRAIVVEADYRQIVEHDFRSAISTESVIASIASWQVCHGIAIHFAGDRVEAAKFVAKTLELIARQVMDWAAAACSVIERKEDNEEIPVKMSSV